MRPTARGLSTALLEPGRRRPGGAEPRPARAAVRPEIRGGPEDGGRGRSGSGGGSALFQQLRQLR